MTIYITLKIYLLAGAWYGIFDDVIKMAAIDIYYIVNIFAIYWPIFIFTSLNETDFNGLIILKVKVKLYYCTKNTLMGNSIPDIWRLSVDFG